MRLGIDIAIAMLWLATGASLSTRTYFVFNYAAVANLPPHLEILAVPLPVLSILILVIVTLLAIRYSQPLAQSSKSTTQSLLPWDWFARVCLVFASLPLILLITRTPTAATSDIGISNPFGASFWWEPILFAGFTGIATYSIFRSNVHLEATGKTSQQKQSSLRTDFDLSQHDGRQPILSSHRTSFLVLCIATLACSGWWYWQSIRMFSEFQLGFNDFGHFLLRVIRTTRGQGLLIESPVLPAFWDHFNPGLLLLVPLWSLWPQAELVFALQAISLAGSAILIYGIAKRRGHSPIGSLCWGLGWLAYPSIGQMNLAYTYGWHPITLAIPCLLLAYYLFILGRWPLAIAAALLASSFEEGAVAAIGAFAFARAAQSLWENRCKINASASA